MERRHDPLPVPTRPPTPTPTGEEITPTSGGTLTDASGNKWTLTSAGVVEENGTPVPNGSGTAAFAIVGNLYYGQDATTQDWYTYSPASQSWTSAAAPVLTPTPTPPPTNQHQHQHQRPPPTPTPTPTASPNDTVVQAGSTGAITDAASNRWTISSSNAVLENGKAAAFSANVAEIAYVSKTVWQENTCNQWYSWTGSGWSAGNDPLSNPAQPRPPHLPPHTDAYPNTSPNETSSTPAQAAHRYQSATAGPYLPP